MKQVIEQNFQLDGIPQAPPRATEDSVQEFPPQLTEGRLNPLPHLTEQELQRRVSVLPGAGRQEHVQDASVDVPQHVQLEAQEPALAGFATVRALVPQQPYPPVP